MVQPRRLLSWIRAHAGRVWMCMSLDRKKFMSFRVSSTMACVTIPPEVLFIIQRALRTCHNRKPAAQFLFFILKVREWEWTLLNWWTWLPKRLVVPCWSPTMNFSRRKRIYSNLPRQFLLRISTPIWGSGWTVGKRAAGARPGLIGASFASAWRESFVGL